MLILGIFFFKKNLQPSKGQPPSGSIQILFAMAKETVAPKGGEKEFAFEVLTANRTYVFLVSSS